MTTTEAPRAEFDRPRRFRRIAKRAVNAAGVTIAALAIASAAASFGYNLQGAVDQLRSNRQPRGTRNSPRAPEQHAHGEPVPTWPRPPTATRDTTGSEPPHRHWTGESSDGKTRVGAPTAPGIRRC